MVSKRIFIATFVALIVILGFVFISNITGYVITGSAAIEESVEYELFRIDEINNGLDNYLNNSNKSEVKNDKS